MAPLIFLFLGPLFSFFAFLLHPLDSFLIDTGLWLIVAFSGLFYLKYRARLTFIEAEKGFFTRGLLFSPVFRLAVILLFGHLLFVFLLALKLPYWPPSRFWYLLDSGEPEGEVGQEPMSLLKDPVEAGEVGEGGEVRLQGSFGGEVAFGEVLALAASP